MLFRSPGLKSNSLMVVSPRELASTTSLVKMIRIDDPEFTTPEVKEVMYSPKAGLMPVAAADLLLADWK